MAAEFGRSPKITRSNAGREHWPDCYSRAVRRRRHPGRQVVRPLRQERRPTPPPTPITPADFTATIYHCLGIDPHGETHDQGGRPFALSRGTPIAELVGS